MIENIHVELKQGFALQKQFSTRRRIIHQQIRHKFKNVISKVLDFERSFVGRWTFDTSESGLEITGEDQLDRSCDTYRGVTKSRGGEEYPSYNKKNEG